MELPFDIQQIIEGLNPYSRFTKSDKPISDPSQPGVIFAERPDDYAGAQEFYDHFANYANGSDNSVANWLLQNSDWQDPNIRNGWYNNILNWLLTLSQRTYEQNRLQDERAYNTPEALLQRLMATGMSRQAALSLLGQMHGGSGSGIGVSSPIPGSSSPLSETQSQRVANYAGAANSLASALASLGQFGINAATAHATNSLNSALAQSQQMSNSAQIQSAELNGLIYDAESKGLISTKDKTFDDTISALRAVTAEQSPKIHSFMNDGKMSALMSTPGSYRIASDNYNTRFNNSNSLQSSLQSALQSQLQQTNLDSALLDYDYSQLKFEDYGINRDLVNQYTMLDYKHKCAMLVAETDPKVIANYKEQLKNDSSFKACNSALRVRMLETLKQDFNNDPSTRDAMNLMFYLDYIGLTGEVGQGVKAAVSIPSILSHGSQIYNLEQAEQSTPIGAKVSDILETMNAPQNGKPVTPAYKSPYDPEYGAPWWLLLLNREIGNGAYRDMSQP